MNSGNGFLNSFTTSLFLSPDKFAEAASRHVRLMIEKEELRPTLGLAWRPARPRLGGKSFPERPPASIHIRGGWNAVTSAVALATYSDDKFFIGQVRRNAASIVSISAAVAGTMVPRAELRKISVEGDDIQQIREFAGTGSKLKEVRGGDSGLRYSATGITCWGLSCDLAPRQRSPADRGFRLSASQPLHAM